MQTKKENKVIDKTLNYLQSLFPDSACELNYFSAYELLIAVILSAQCTDKRVNDVTKILFKIANTPQKMVELGEDNLKTYIKSCGFFNQKAKSIISTSKDLIEKFSGNVPSTMNELTSLRGVGRKTANVVIGTAFSGQTIAVDTHVLRVSKRLGFCKNNDNPNKCEQALLKIVPFDKRTQFHHQMVLFGRYHCKSRKPNCLNCELKDDCLYYKNRL